MCWLPPTHSNPLMMTYWTGSRCEAPSRGEAIDGRHPGRPGAAGRAAGGAEELAALRGRRAGAAQLLVSRDVVARPAAEAGGRRPVRRADRAPARPRQGLRPRGYLPAPGRAALGRPAGVSGHADLPLPRLDVLPADRPAESRAYRWARLPHPRQGAGED